MKNILLILFSINCICCKSKQDFTFTTQNLPYVYIIPNFNKNNVSDSTYVIWKPIKYTISTKNKLTYFPLISLGNKEKMYTHFDDYILFKNDSLISPYIETDNLKNQFILVTNSLRINKNTLDSLSLINKTSKPPKNLIKIPIDKINLNDLDKNNYINDSIYIRIVNEKGKTLQILKDKIDYK